MIRQKPVATTINLPSESNIIAKDTSYDKMVELETKAEQLQNELRKRDQVIMGQIKVITYLTNMIKNVMFGSLFPNGFLL